MAYEVEAFGKIIEVPDDVPKHEAYKQIMANKHKLGYDEFTDPANFVEQEPEALDYAKGFASGANKLVSGVGYLAEAAGAKDTGKAIREFGDRGAAYWNERMSPGGKKAAESQVFVDDPDSITGLRLGDDAGKALLMGAAQSLPSMFAAALPGVAITKGIQALASLGLAGGAGATIPLLAGTAAPVGVASQVIARAPAAIGFGSAEGLLAGGTNAAGLKTSIEGMSDKELLKSPVYQALRAQHGEEKARTMLADQAASDLFGKTAVSTGAIGALTGGGALGSAYQKVTSGAANGILMTGLKGGGQEVIQEMPQSGGEKYIENITRKEYLDPSVDPMAGVIAEAASGGAIAAFTGGIVGAGSAINITKQKITPIADAPTIDDAIVAAHEAIRTEDPTLDDLKGAQKNETQATIDAGQPQAAEVLTRVKQSESIRKQEYIPTGEIIDEEIPESSVSGRQGRGRPTLIGGTEESPVGEDNKPAGVGSKNRKVDSGVQQTAEVLDIVLPDNTSVKAQWKIVDADQLAASMKEDVNQPRDRTRVASDVQIKSIANAPDYRRLSDSPVMDVGAPVVDQSGRIVAGNGRFAGLSQAYDQGTATEYLNQLRADAARKGLSIEGIAKPVLVRQLSEPVDTRKMAIASNSGATLQMSALEQAKLDAERMKGIENLDVNDLGDIALTPRNLTQLKDSLGTYTENELAAIQDKGGQLSQEGVRRVRNAMLAKAYGTSPVLEKLIESTDTDMRNVLGALTKSASHIIGTKGDTKALLEAVDTYAQLKATGQPVDNFLAQQDAFSEGLNKEAEGILRFIDTNIRSQKKLTDFFKGNFVEVDTTSDDMFSTPQPALQSVEPKSDGATRHPNAKAASKDASWVIKNKATGEMLFETFDKAKVDALNTSKYEAVPIYEHLTGLNKDERIAKLEKHLKDNGYNFRVEPASVRDVDDLDSTKKARKELAEKQAKLFKKKVVFVKANGPFKINGVMVPSIADTIFVDIRTDKAFDAIMAHELSHWMEQEKPAVYKELVKSLKTVIINEAEYAKKYGIEGATKAEITKEIVGDLIGDNFTEQSFWQKVAEANPNAFKDIAATIIKWLKGVIVKAKANGMGSEQWVKDATKAQDIIAKAVAQYTESEASPVSAEGKPKFNADKKTVTVDGVERPTTNSEGKPINNPVNFWKWFGDSKVVDDQGRPMVVYHGTDKAFSKVNVKKGAQNLFWFSSDRESILAGKSGASSVNKIMSLYVRIENPANWKQYDSLGISEFSRDRLDGAILPRKSGQFDGFVLDGSQVKSIDNNGDFSTTDMRLKFSRAPKQAGFDFGKINLDYGNIEQRPGTTEKQRDVGVSAYQSLLERVADRAGARVLGLAMAKDFREQSGSSLIGKEVATPDDLATVAQVLRDPRFETFRAFYVKDGKIVHHTGLTSRLPGAVNVISAMEGESQEAATERFFTDMRQQKLDSGADGYYLLHNHPSGRAVPSTADELITEAIADQVPGFISHIVINSNEYSTITRNGQSKLVQRDLTGGYGTEAMIPHDALQGRVINGPASMAEVGKLLQRTGPFFTLLGLSAQNKVISISEVPLSVLAKSDTRLVGMMRRFARNGGANRFSVVAHADELMRFKDAVEAGVLLDAVDTDGNSLRENPRVASPSGSLFGDSDKPAIRVAQFSRAPAKLDAEYMDAVNSGDMEKAQGMVDSAAREKGYISGADYRMMHQAPNRDDYSMATIKESDIVPDDYWTHPHYYQNDATERSSFYKVKAAIDSTSQKLWVFRSVPKNVKDDSLRNGDWVSPSREYAKLEGEAIPGGYKIIAQRASLKDLWWDVNSINEIGYDDGKEYAYKNTKNNRKLLDAVTYDDEGNVIPLSKRFNSRKSEPKFSRAPKSLNAVEKSWDSKGITHSLSERNGIVTLNKIVVPKDSRNAGVGTDAMRELTDYADATNQQIALTPSADFGGNKSKLQSFYKRFGFRKNNEFNVMESMIRDPELSTVTVDGVERPTTNSEGKPINNPVNFWKWFGDSEVVDDQGRPLVVYHSTDADISTFDKNKLGENTLGNASDESYAATSLIGFWFNSNPLAGTSNMPSSINMPVYIKAESIRDEGSLANLAQGVGEYLTGDLVEDYDNDLFNYTNNAASDYIDSSERNGYDGVKILDEEFGGVSYAVFSPNQIKSAIGNNGDYSRTDNDIRFSKEPAKPTPPDESRLRRFQRMNQDSFNRFTVIKEWLAENGQTLSDKADVHGAEERYHSMAANQLEDFREQQRNPLIEKIQKAGYTLGDIEVFLKMQHTPEANAQIRKLGDNPDATAYGITDDEAADYLGEAPEKLATLANELRDITEQTKKLRLDAGILNTDITDAWEGAYKHYVPVKGEADSTRGVGKGLKTNFKSKRRLGHSLRDEHVIENILMDHERAILEVERNRVGKHLVMMAAEMQRPDILSIGQPEKRKMLKESTAYTVEANGVVQGVFKSREEAKMFRQIIQGGLFEGTPTNSIKINQTKDQRVIASASPMLAENEVNVYMNGHAIRVQINDELLARAYTKMGVEQFSDIVAAGRILNGYLSKVYTGYNPEFILTNMIRDFSSGTINLTGEQGFGMAAKALTNYPRMFSDLLKYAATNGKSSTKWIDSYRANGGNTGAAYLSDMERLGNEVSTEYASHQGVMSNLKQGDNANAARAAGRKVFNATLKWIYNLNQAGENAMRLAAFKAMLDSGRTVNEAAKVAKNITVNFNRKGERQWAPALYLFYNASVQGTAATGHALFKGKHKGQAWALAGSMAAVGYMVAAAFGGGSEDDWDEINDYTKERNMLIKSGDGYVKVPVPYGYGFFWNLGRYMSEAQRTGEWGKMPWHLATSAMSELTPFNDVVVGSDEEFRSDQVFMGLLPTAMKIVAQPTFNKQLFTGSELMPDSPFDKSQPDREKMFRSTKGTMYDEVAGWLEAAGIDISPETLKYTTRTFTGGAGSLVDTGISAAMLKAEGAELDTQEIPFVRKGYMELGIKDKRAAYYKVREEARTAAEELNRARRANDTAKMQTVLKDKNELIALDRFANKLAAVIDAARDQQDAVRADEKLSVQEKRLKLKDMEAQEAKFYDQYLDVFKTSVKR